MESKEFVKEYINHQYARYQEMKEWLPFVKLSGNADVLRKCKEIEAVKRTINRSVQIGSFRRAVLYVAILKNILDDLEGTKDIISQELTELLLKDDSDCVKVHSIPKKNKKHSRR